MLWKSSIVNSVKPWDTRSSLLLADTALNLWWRGMGGQHGLLSQQNKGLAAQPCPDKTTHQVQREASTARSPGARPPARPPAYRCSSLLSSSSASKWEKPNAR